MANAMCIIQSNGDAFIAANSEIPWNAQGTAVNWSCIWPAHKRVIMTAEGLSTSQIYEVALTALPPLKRIGDTIVVLDTETHWNIDQIMWWNDKQVPTESTRNMTIVDFTYDDQQYKWIYVVKPFNTENSPPSRMMAVYERKD